jgi:UDP-glucose 4-epimerase
VKHFIFSSTAAVYGNPERVPVSEDDPTAPLSPYGWSKLMTEQMLRDAGAAYGLNHVILRYFNVAGADPKGRTGLSTAGATHLIKVAVETALDRRPHMDVFGTDYPTPDGTCIRDFIHVSDLAHAHLAALDYLRSGGTSQTLNCGYGRGYSVLEVLSAVGRACGHRLAVNLTERRPGDIMSSIADASRIRKLLAWTPELDDLDLIVTHALAWERHLMAPQDPARPAVSA